MSSSSVRPWPRVHQHHHPGQVLARHQVIGHHLLPADLVGLGNGGIAVPGQVGQHGIGHALLAQLEQVDRLGASGGLGAKARRFCCVSVLMQVDLPALERPTKAISGTSRRGQVLQPRRRGEETGRVQPGDSLRRGGGGHGEPGGRGVGIVESRGFAPIKPKKREQDACLLLLAALLAISALSTWAQQPAASAPAPAASAAAPAAHGTPAPAAAPAVAKADAAAGEAKFGAVCVACHGAGGNSGTPANPKLSQQHDAYIVKQLQEFKAGKRASPIMQGFASQLSDQDMKNVAAYLGTQKAKPNFAKDKELVSLGEKIYRGGIQNRQLPACAGCHSPNGFGHPRPVPAPVRPARRLHGGPAGRPSATACARTARR
jgi:cytochrome c553